MIKICPNCSSVNIDKIKELVGKDNLTEGCIGRCGTPYAAIVDFDAIICDSEDELYEEIKKRVS